MRARSNVYHLECFACQECGHRFCVGDQFFLHDNKVIMMMMMMIMIIVMMMMMMMMMLCQTAGSGSKRLDLSGVSEARAGAGGVVLKRTRGGAGDTASTESPSPESLLEDTVSTPTGICNLE